jgi:branched-chain amino acid transport system substrate-binding protein
MAWLRDALLAFAFAALAACPAAADVLVGVAVPARGPEAIVGADILRAARLAAERFNAEGGAAGERIAIVEADDGCATQPAEDAARALIERHVAVVIGHPCGSAAVAAARLYAEAGVPFIAAATRHPALTDQRAGPAVFRLAGRDGHQGTIAGNFLAREFAGKPLAIVYGGSVYSKELAAEATAALKAAGRADVPTGTIASGQKEYGPLVGKLAGAHVEAVYFAGYPIEAGLLLRQMRAAGLQAAFFGSDTIAGEQFAQAAGEGAEGAGTLLPYDPVRSLSPEALRTAFPKAEPTAPFVLAYAAMEAWRGAVQQAQSTAGDGVAKALQGSGFNTVLGRLTFDPKGDAELPAYDIVWWRDGAWRSRRQ